MSYEPLVIHPPRPWLKITLAVIYVITLIVASWLSFNYGRSRAGFDSVSAEDQIAKLNQRQQQLERWNTELRERATIVEGGREIDRQAYKQVETSLKDLQAEILDLRKENAFYRSIVSPTKAGAGQGLKVQSVKFDSKGPAGEYRYKLVLAQTSQTSKPSRGQILLVIQGTQNGAAKRLNMAELTKAKTGLRYNFKNFQSLEGDIKLPKDFAPAKLLVRVISDGKTPAQFDRTFDWPEVST